MTISSSVAGTVTRSDDPVSGTAAVPSYGASARLFDLRPSRQLDGGIDTMQRSA